MKIDHQKKISTAETQSAIRQALPQISAVCVKNILLLGFGMTLGFPTILIPSLSGKDPDERIVLGQEAISWISSINLICVPLGCLISGSVTQAIGRRRAMQFVNIPFLSSWLLYHFSTSEWQIFLASCLTGLTGGLLEAPVLTYVAEITQPHLRGILASTSTLAVTLGLLTQFLLGTFFKWRTVVLINCCIPIASFTSLMFVPETPTWLISKKRYEDAKKSLAWLRGWTKVENIESEYQELYKHITMGPGSNANSNGSAYVKNESFLDRLKLFTKKNFIWPYTLVTLAFFLSHFNGNTTLGVYAIQIFSELKAPINHYYATVIMGTVQLLGCIICVSTISLFGKRILNFFSLFTSALCFFIVAFYAYSTNVFYFAQLKDVNSTFLSNSTDNSLTSETYHWVPVTFLVISAFLTYLGIKVLPWILIAEVYSNETRAIASGLSSAIGYVLGFVSNKIFLSQVSTLTLPGVFLFYGFIGLLGTVLLYFGLPETEGKSLHEISDHFAGRNKLTNSIRRHSKTQSLGHDNLVFVPDNKTEDEESRL